MTRSMTGFGKSSRTLKDFNISFEVRTLNSKQLDIGMRLPAMLNGRETLFRQIISKRLLRGKVSLACTLERLSGSDDRLLDHDLVIAYLAELREIARATGSEGSDLLAIAMRLPEVSKPVREDLDEEEWKEVDAALAEALDACDVFRITEGAHLAGELGKRVGIIRELLSAVPAFEQGRLDRIRQRITEELGRLVNEDDIDRSRLEQELIYYIEKLDITEEKVRLEGHCQHFLDTLGQDDDTGKKLGFISQEMGREINTIGSKANDLDIQKIVVQMKDELEKIKEQCLNVL